MNGLAPPVDEDDVFHRSSQTLGNRYCESKSGLIGMVFFLPFRCHLWEIKDQDMQVDIPKLALIFTFMHLTNALIQSDLHCIQAIHFIRSDP